MKPGDAFNMLPMQASPPQTPGVRWILPGEPGMGVLPARALMNITKSNILSEDLSHSTSYFGITVENPFAVVSNESDK